MPNTSKFPTGDVHLDETATRFLKTKKPGTAKAYKVALRRFNYYYGRPLADFIQEIEQETEQNKNRSLTARIRPGEATTRGFIKWLEETGFAPKSARQSLAALQNYLKYYGVNLSLEFIQLPPDRPLKQNDKHEWTLDQVKQLVDACEYLRDKALVLTAFQSGLSLGDILKLDYRDIKREYEAGTLPLAMQGYREKTGVQVRTFIGADAVRYLRLYLKSREPLKDNAPLFTKLGTEKRLPRNAVCVMLRRYAEKLNFIYEEDLENSFNPARAHSLRAAFRSRLTGKMDGQLIEFLMGHEIGQEKSTYINIPLDELREIYANYEHLLAVEKTSRDELTALSDSAQGISKAAFQNLTERVGQVEAENAELRAQLEEVQTWIRERERYEKTREKMVA
ncbi:MAG: site-specific integrase [Candidatus Bathyarchaeota archaeon]